MSSDSSMEDLRRAHIERMIVRAKKRSRQAQKIVPNWEAKLAELNREGVVVKQARLWKEEHPCEEENACS